MYLYCRIRGIKFHRTNVFYGRSFLRKCIYSQIIIDRNNVFRNTISSNFGGISYKCILTTLREGAKLKIGNKCGISSTTIGAVDSIQISDSSLIGANVFITDFDWHMIHPKQRDKTSGDIAFKAIIEDNIWLAVNSLILKGVKIEQNAAIRANCVVTKSIPENDITAGNPYFIIKNLN